jgi:hypothetical protein
VNKFISCISQHAANEFVPPFLRFAGAVKGQALPKAIGVSDGLKTSTCFLSRYGID